VTVKQYIGSYKSCDFMGTFIKLVQEYGQKQRTFSELIEVTINFLDKFGKSEETFLIQRRQQTSN